MKKALIETPCFTVYILFSSFHNLLPFSLKRKKEKRKIGRKKEKVEMPSIHHLQGNNVQLFKEKIPSPTPCPHLQSSLLS